MLRLHLTNFGPFDCLDLELSRDLYIPNGGGKTTIVNALHWLYTGRTITGAPARRTDAPEGEDTVVRSQIPKPDGTCFDLTRTLRAGAQFLTLNGSRVSPKDLAERYPLDFMAACVNVDALTHPMTSAQMRGLLGVCGMMNTEQLDELKAERRELKKRLEIVKNRAAVDAPPPVRVTPPMLGAELRVIDDYEAANELLRAEVEVICPRCGRPLSDDDLRERKKERDRAELTISELSKAYEVATSHRVAWDKECEEVERYQREQTYRRDALAELSTLERRIAEIEIEIVKASKEAQRGYLVPGLTVATAKGVKTTGRSIDTCELYLNGMPLKAVNRAQRMVVLAQVLDAARANLGVPWIPIVVDNAESVAEWPEIDNFITLNVQR